MKYMTKRFLYLLPYQLRISVCEIPCETTASHMKFVTDCWVALFFFSLLCIQYEIEAAGAIIEILPNLQSINADQLPLTGLFATEKENGCIKENFTSIFKALRKLGNEGFNRFLTFLSTEYEVKPLTFTDWLGKFLDLQEHKNSPEMQRIIYLITTLKSKELEECLNKTTSSNFIQKVKALLLISWLRQRVAQVIAKFHSKFSNCQLEGDKEVKLIGSIEGLIDLTEGDKFDQIGAKFWLIDSNLGHCISMVKVFENIDSAFDAIEAIFDVLTECTNAQNINVERISSLGLEGWIPCQNIFQPARSIIAFSVEFSKTNQPFLHAPSSLPEEASFSSIEKPKAKLPIAIGGTLHERIFLKEANAPQIEIINTVDSQAIPKDFQYIEECIYSPKVSPPNFDLLVGCVCLDCDKSDYCPCKETNNEHPSYNKQGYFINFETKTAVFECNDRCLCGPACSTRVVQKGRKIPLLLQRFGDGRGWGVLAKQTIPKGTFVAQYAGEIITDQEASERYAKYKSTDAHHMMYLFNLDYNYEPGFGCDFMIDAFKYGNISHFINHSCEPNLTVRPVFVNNLDPRMHLIALFAAKEILPGEELCYDYMGLRDGSNNDNVQPLKRLKTPKLKCLCGTATCRRHVFV